MKRYKKGATITDSPNVLHNGKLHINCQDPHLLRLTGWVEMKEATTTWAKVWEALKRGIMQ